MVKMEVSLGLTKCSDCEKFNIGLEIYSLFEWGRGFNAISFDKETQEILVDEGQLMRIIQMVNPLQQVRKIKLISQDEHLKRLCSK